MNKTLLLLALLIILGIPEVLAQNTIDLSTLTVKKSNTEFRINDIIGGTDYTYLSDDYSAKDTRFFKDNKLFTGVATINNAGQQTSIHFKKGQLHGLWHDIMMNNNGLLHKGKYKKGVRYGMWVEGYQNEETNTIEIYKRENYKKGLLHGIQKNYASYYSNRTFVGDGYEAIKFKEGKRISIPKYYNAQGKLRDGVVQTKSETSTFKKGIIIKQEIRKGTQVIQTNEYALDELTYNILEIKYHDNGKLKSKGVLKDFYKKSGEWLYYNERGILAKKELWEYDPSLDFPSRKKTIYFKEDGRIDKTKNR